MASTRKVIDGVGHYDLGQEAADFDLRETNRKRTQDMLREADPLGLRYLEETSLSRVWRHANDPQTSFGILTAFRRADVGKEKEQAQINLENNRKLADDLRQAGFGYFFLRGNYVMQGGEKVQEVSLCVVGRRGQGQELRQLVEHLRQKYQQESVLFKPEGSDEAFLLYADRTESIGRFHPGRVSDFMSELVFGAGKGGTFVFEEVVHTSVRRGMWDAYSTSRSMARRIGAPGPL